MTGGVGDGTNDRNRVGSAVVGSSRSVEGPGGAKFNCLVRAAAGDHWCGGVDYSHFLAAGSAVAASVGRLPGAGRIEGPVTMTDSVRYRADDGDRVGSAVVGGSRRIKSPNGAELNSLIGIAAGDHWRGGVDYSHFLTARSAIAASIGRLPGAGCIEGVTAMTGGVGDRADDCDGVGSAVVGSGRRIKSPDGAKLNGLIGIAAGDHWRGGVDYSHFLTARSAVAASIGRLPGAGCIEGVTAM